MNNKNTALDGVKQMVADGVISQDVVERYFPELREAEDERIRKAIVQFFELQDDNTTFSFVPKKDILAWLEKQKPTYHPVPTKEPTGVLKQLIDEEAWSAEDEKMLEKTFKSLKDRIVPQPKEWSNDDEQNLQTILFHLRMDKAKARTHELRTFDKLIDWLEELKDRFVPKQNGTS